MFQQHSRYLSSLRDTNNTSLTPASLNRNNTHTQSWVSVVSEEGTANDFLFNPTELFESQGNLIVRTSNYGKVIRIQSNEGFANPTFVQGDSIEAVAVTIVEDVLGYNLEEYEQVQYNLSDTLQLGEEVETITNTPETTEGAESNKVEISWKRKAISAKTPEFLSISLEPVVKEFSNQSGFSTKFGYAISSFEAKNRFEPSNLNIPGSDELTAFQILFFICVFVLTILVFVVGIGNIFKGKVEWKRTLFIFISIALAYFGWRMIFFWSVFGVFLTGDISLLIVLNNLLVGLIIGLYASVAYTSWEAFARSQKKWAG